MATIRKRRGKYQVQIRHLGMRAASRSFHRRQDAEAWARQMGVLADKTELPADRRILRRITLVELVELVERDRDTVSINKRGYKIERAVLSSTATTCLFRLPH